MTIGKVNINKMEEDHGNTEEYEKMMEIMRANGIWEGEEEIKVNSNFVIILNCSSAGIQGFLEQIQGIKIPKIK